MSLPPVTSVAIKGRPMTDEVRAIFGPWGHAEGVLVTSAGSLVVTFKGTGAVEFAPVSLFNEEKSHEDG